MTSIFQTFSKRISMMHYPDFFDDAPVITLYDPLAEFLGAADGGVMEYRYLDVVRLAGHSCPTVACAFLMTRVALHALYADKLPVRGEIQVDFRDAQQDGTTGVVANVLGLITGAAGPGGFKGIDGRFHRDGLLGSGADIDGQILLTRTDTGAAVGVSVNPGHIPSNPHLRELLALCLAGTATETKQTDFRELWQSRVWTLLLNHADDPEVIITRMLPDDPQPKSHQGRTATGSTS